jgi:hypothetical protein
MMRGKKSLFLVFFLFIEKKNDWRKRFPFFLLSFSHSFFRLFFSDITCSHLIASSDRLEWIQVITVHITLSTNEKYPVVGIKTNSTRDRENVHGVSTISTFLWPTRIMEHLTALPEINDDDNCHLESFTNKLPYYVRHLCKSTNKNKTATVISNPSKYFERTLRRQTFICWEGEKIKNSLV